MYYLSGLQYEHVQEPLIELIQMCGILCVTITKVFRAEN